MLFPTIEYALFFLSVLGIAWILYRWPIAHKSFLLAASYLFYGFWNWSFVPLLAVISLFAALVARKIQSSEAAQPRKKWLTIGIVACLAVLAYYKYTAFVLTNILMLLAHTGHAPQWQVASPLLPLGVSFFVFHAISLLMDCYRGKLKERVNIGDALLYVAFFPQLIAGPILRASRFMPQLNKPRDPRSLRIHRALLLIVGGLFKKVVLSNMLATRLVEQVFQSPQSYGSLDTLLAIYGYAAQIYCDFSGYTDIATGCALLLGYRFPRNFHAPYTSTSPQEFWRRWHISLSTWLRDYLYFPLGGSRKGQLRTAINLLATMLIGGLWHGAAWTFVAWGGLHGLYLVVHRQWTRIAWKPVVTLRSMRAWPWIARFLCFHAVCLGWVFFRASSFELAFSVLQRLSVPATATLITTPVLFVLFFGLAGQFFPSRWRSALEVEMTRWPAFVTGAAFALALIAIEVLGPSGVAPFIYFQF